MDKANNLALLSGGKVPPQMIDLEEAVLGSIIEYGENAHSVMDILTDSAFYVEANRIIFRAIASLYMKRMPIDMLTVQSELKKMGQLEMVGGNYYIVSLTQKVVNSAINIETHAHLIKEAFYKREIIRISQLTIQNAYNDTSDAFDLVDGMSEVYDVISSDIGQSMQSVGTIFIERLKAYEQAVKDGITGVPSGFKELDRLTAGWQKSDLIIAAGRPAMGKTAFVVSCARNAAVDFKKPVLIFSLEMTKEQLVDRMVSSEAEIESQTIRTRSIKDWEWVALHNKATVIEEAPIIIDDTPGLSLVQFTAKAKKAKRDHDIQLIIIDYLQLMKATREKGAAMNREQEISSISRGLKLVAKELGVPVIALSQLSRALESRPGMSGKRPKLSDLRESGSIEQDADLVLFLFRPEYYGMTEDEQGRSTAGVAEIIIAKQRTGDTGTAVLRFIGKYTKFTDLEADFGIDMAPPFNAYAGLAPSNFYEVDHDDDDDPPF